MQSEGGVNEKYYEIPENGFLHSPPFVSSKILLKKLQGLQRSSFSSDTPDKTHNDGICYEQEVSHEIRQFAREYEELINQANKPKHLLTPREYLDLLNGYIRNEGLSFEMRVSSKKSISRPQYQSPYLFHDSNSTKHNFPSSNEITEKPRAATSLGKAQLGSGIYKYPLQQKDIPVCFEFHLLEREIISKLREELTYFQFMYRKVLDSLRLSRHENGQLREKTEELTKAHNDEKDNWVTLFNKVQPQNIMMHKEIAAYEQREQVFRKEKKVLEDKIIELEQWFQSHITEKHQLQQIGNDCKFHQSLIRSNSSTKAPATKSDPSELQTAQTTADYFNKLAAHYEGMAKDLQRELDDSIREQELEKNTILKLQETISKLQLDLRHTDNQKVELTVKVEQLNTKNKKLRKQLIAMDKENSQKQTETVQQKKILQKEVEVLLNSMVTHGDPTKDTTMDYWGSQTQLLKLKELAKKLPPPFVYDEEEIERVFGRVSTNTQQFLEGRETNNSHKGELSIFQGNKKNSLQDQCIGGDERNHIPSHPDLIMDRLTVNGISITSPFQEREGVTTDAALLIANNDSTSNELRRNRVTIDSSLLTDGFQPLATEPPKSLFLPDMRLNHSYNINNTQPQGFKMMDKVRGALSRSIRDSDNLLPDIPRKEYEKQQIVNSLTIDGQNANNMSNITKQSPLLANIFKRGKILRDNRARRRNELQRRSKNNSTLQQPLLIRSSNVIL